MSAAILLLFRLYLIEILHQTTTVSAISAFLFGCILLKFYIKPQQSSYCLVSFEVVSYWNSTSNHNEQICWSYSYLLYLIEILHQTTTGSWTVTAYRRCILLKFYIKPQHWQIRFRCWQSCILLKFYIKPQQAAVFPIWQICCILLKFYIKPQQQGRNTHQIAGCILLKFYIKPQRRPYTRSSHHGCILLKFYIKPQRCMISTWKTWSCILLKFYIKPQRELRLGRSRRGCILLKFYIKPQRRASYWLIKCYLRAVCHYKNTIGCSDEASLMHFPYFKERK